MKLFGALAFLIMTISTVHGLRCFTCTATKHSCTDTKSCPVIFNRCFTYDDNNMVSKGCQSSSECGGAIACCEGDLCNSGEHAGPSTICEGDLCNSSEHAGPCTILLLLSTAAVLFSSI